jgi:hypothetical protein
MEQLTSKRWPWGCIGVIVSFLRRGAIRILGVYARIMVRLARVGRLDVKQLAGCCI